jgi:hypothetical protein
VVDPQRDLIQDGAHRCGSLVERARPVGVVADDADRLAGQPCAFSLRQPPARLLAMICSKIRLSAPALISSPARIATVRAVLFS